MSLSCTPSQNMPSSLTETLVDTHVAYVCRAERAILETSPTPRPPPWHPITHPCPGRHEVINYCQDDVAVDAAQDKPAARMSPTGRAQESALPLISKTFATWWSLLSTVVTTGRQNRFAAKRGACHPKEMTILMHHGRNGSTQQLRTRLPLNQSGSPCLVSQLTESHI